MITKERLREATSERAAQEIYSELRQQGNYLDFTRLYMHEEDHRVARNAFWVLTKATDKELEQLQTILHDLIDLAMKTENAAVRRLSLNIIERLQMKEDDLRTDFLDFSLEHMADPEEFPGIQCLCMKMAYRMCLFYPELMGELKRTLEAMEIYNYKASVKSLWKKILKEIARQDACH
ncbi:MAG: hypothetical protein IKK04_08875 [Bacteroidales bacterium]|nr:hypothetical protein [Bacteroidales bacterium]